MKSEAITRPFRVTVEGLLLSLFRGVRGAQGKEGWTKLTPEFQSLTTIHPKDLIVSERGPFGVRVTLTPEAHKAVTNDAVIGET